jgi:chaperone required for assembly of F1-ATPase
LWQASRIDEEWQIEHWGRDPEAEAAAADRRAAFFQAAAFLAACAAGNPGDPRT